MIIPEEIISVLEPRGIKYEVWRFDSGCSIIDIWLGDKFYVIHLEPEVHIGLSLIDENVGLDNNPDEKYYDKESFMQRLEKVLASIPG